MNLTLATYLAVAQFRSGILTELMSRGYRWTGVKPILYSILRGDTVVITKTEMQDDAIAAAKAGLAAVHPGVAMCLVDIRSRKRVTSLRGDAISTRCTRRLHVRA